jgi:hypothetical protein
MKRSIIRHQYNGHADIVGRFFFPLNWEKENPHDQFRKRKNSYNVTKSLKRFLHALIYGVKIVEAD